MCQARGKRCLIHASASKFAVRSTQVKTKVDEVTVRKTLSELNKEGKNLPEASAEDVHGWIENKKFATQYDPALDNHERKIQLAQLERAKKETKDGVAGNHLYAWKNLMRRVKQKAARPALAITMAAGIAATMAGCMQGPAPEPVAPNPTTSNSAPATPQPVNTGTPGEVYGNAKGTEQIITDQFGDYEKITIDPNSPALKYDPSVVDQSAYDAGWNDEQIAAAQEHAVKFFAEEAVDSSALDTKNFRDWANTTGAEYVTDSEEDIILQDGSGIIVTNTTAGNVPVLIRDGQPRISNLDIKVTGIDGGSSAIGPYVRVITSITADYRVSDENLTSFLVEQNPQMSEQEVKDSLQDHVKDGTGENTFAYTNLQAIGMGQVNGEWKIGGYVTEVPTFNTQDFLK